MNSLTNYLVNEVSGRDLVGLRIRSTENVQQTVIRVTLRRCDQLKSDVVWDVLRKVILKIATLGLTNRLEVHSDHARMSAGNGGVKKKGLSIDVLSAVKKNIVAVKASFLFLAHELIIDMARVSVDPKYETYRWISTRSAC